MSEPKRYTDLQVWETLHFAGSTNGWVRWEDYKRIATSIDEARLDALNKNVVLKVENARLKAEVERLTKLCQATSPDGFIHIRDINAAKEGKQS